MNIRLFTVDNVGVEYIFRWLQNKALLWRARIQDSLSISDILSYLPNGKVWSFLICVDSVPIGYCRIEFGYAGGGSIGLVIAEKKYRRKGIGYIVCNRLLDICRSLGMEYVTWTTENGNTPSKNLAKKLGFQVYEKHPIENKKRKFTLLKYEKKL